MPTRKPNNFNSYKEQTPIITSPHYTCNDNALFYHKKYSTKLQRPIRDKPNRSDIQKRRQHEKLIRFHPASRSGFFHDPKSWRPLRTRLWHFKDRREAQIRSLPSEALSKLIYFAWLNGPSEFGLTFFSSQSRNLWHFYATDRYWKRKGVTKPTLHCSSLRYVSLLVGVLSLFKGRKRFSCRFLGNKCFSVRLVIIWKKFTIS